MDLVVPLAIVALSQSLGAQIILVPNRGDIGGTTIDWGDLGAPFTPVPGTFALAAGSNVVTVSNSTGTPMERRDQVSCDFWDGNFSPCERLLWTNNTPPTGPLTFSFATPIFAFGTNIQADEPGPFTATLSLFVGGSLLGTVTRGGLSNNNADGSAIFIGAGSATPFDQVVLGLTVASADPGDFAINGPAFGTVVPEPTTLVLLVPTLGVFGALGTLRRRHTTRNA